jgi:hypothetical protein
VDTVPDHLHHGLVPPSGASSAGVSRELDQRRPRLTREVKCP